MINIYQDHLKFDFAGPFATLNLATSFKVKVSRKFEVKAIIIEQKMAVF
jgi:hypothetical protein